MNRRHFNGSLFSLAASIKAQAQKIRFLDLSGLINHKGEKTQKTLLPGKYSFGFSGFTKCQGPCPMMRYKMAQALKLLPDEMRTMIAPFMITTDPANDTPEVLKEYFGNSGIVGITGDQKIIDKALTAAGIGHDMLSHEHDTNFRVIDEKGQIITSIPFVLEVPRIAQILRETIEKRKAPAPLRAPEL
jgi:cytochrome oxidase Cu insertion factor (SCO1/SenC/PrrC family)